MDTITLMRSAMRSLLKLVDGTDLGREPLASLSSGDDYATDAKPQIA